MTEHTALPEEDQQADSSADNTENQTIPEVKKGNDPLAIVAFLGLFLCLVGGFAYFKFFHETEEEIASTAQPGGGAYGGSSRVSNGRVFHFDDEPPPPTGTGIAPPGTSEPPPSPAGGEVTPYVPPPLIVDKSASSMVPRHYSSGGGLASGFLTGGAGSNTKQDELMLRAKNLQQQIEGQGNSGGDQSGAGLFGQRGTTDLGRQLRGTKTEKAVASHLGKRDFLLAKGAYIDCVLNTRLNSSVAGMAKCTLTHNIYSDNGNILLLERGSTVTGEYKRGISQGQTRLFMLWDRIKTPSGVVVNLDSPATDPLGASGVEGHIDTHFWTRFGGAMMLSLIDDTAAYLASRDNNGNTVRFENTSDMSQNMAAEALKNTINIPATLSKNQGARVGIFVARDVDFSSVYRLSVKQKSGG